MKAKIIKFSQYCLNLQKEICSSIEKFEPQKKFLFDKWQKSKEEKFGGNGCSAIIANGQTIEKGGVNYSYIKGNKLPASATKKHLKIGHLAFEALGLSIIMHPTNPYAPTSHCNIRLFCSSNTNKKQKNWWFGGGFDLTPYYGFKEDCILWHQAAKKACEPFGDGVYEKFKTWCDSYFYLPHRQEQRGIGGLFFDDLNEWDFNKCFEFIKAISQTYYEIYSQILKRRYKTKYSQDNRQFQLFRRGRYVEFNLLYDRGTLFGIKSGGRMESILISLPPKVKWHYNYIVKKNSEEEKLTNYYLKPQNWLNK